MSDFHRSAGTAASLTERLIDAAVDYERSEGRQGKEARQELSKARAAVEAAITNAAQPSAKPCAHEAIIGLDGKWHCRKCGDAIDIAVAQSSPEQHNLPGHEETQDALKRLRSIVASARGNAKAAKIKDDDLTWQAHAREVERVSKMLRGLIGKEPADAVSTTGEPNG